jgi:hypothetical protein
MNTSAVPSPASRYAKCVETSKRVRWDIDRDVIRGRRFDVTKKFLPDGLSQVENLDFLSRAERRLLSQIQGRTYAGIFGLVERFIGAKVLELTQAHWLGDQVALEALVGFTGEELKHQELFRRLEQLMGEVMPAGYVFALDPDAVAKAVLSKSTWAVLALTCHIELFTQQHYKQSIEPNSELSDLYKDVFLFHWKEESQHAILDELEWKAEDLRLGDAERDRAVDDLIALVGAVDGLLQSQTIEDAAYFDRVVGRMMSGTERERVFEAILAAYRYQYIVSGVTSPRFGELLFSKLNEAQQDRVGRALRPFLGTAGKEAVTLTR